MRLQRLCVERRLRFGDALSFGGRIGVIAAAFFGVFSDLGQLGVAFSASIGDFLAGAKFLFLAGFHFAVVEVFGTG